MTKEKAKRWKICEGVKALREGNVKARIDLATRFPLFSTATDEEILDEITLMTVRQVEIRMKKKLLKGYTEPDEPEEELDEPESENEGYMVGHDDIKHLLPKPEPEEEIDEEKEDTDTAEEFYGDDPDEHTPDEKVEEVKPEVVEPEEKATEEPKPEPKEDITEDDLDDLFDDVE